MKNVEQWNKKAWNTRARKDTKDDIEKWRELKQIRGKGSKNNEFEG